MSELEAIHVCVVEHELADVELEIAELESAGFRVTSDVAATEEGFRELLLRNEYDVVLADYRLPGWTGMRALEVLQALRPLTPLILVTGTLGEERAVDCLHRGVADYILKTNLARLPIAVRRAVLEAHTRRQHQKSEDLIRKLTIAVDQSPAAILITDPSGVIEYVNQRFTEVTGYERDEAIGRNASLLNSSNTESAVYAEMWDVIKKGSSWRGELQNRRKNGESYWDDVTIAPLRDGTGAISNFLAIQEEVTERRAIELRLREREERFRQLADNIEEVFFLVDRDFRETVYINPAYERLWGRTSESLYENPRSFFDAVKPLHRGALERSITRARDGVVSGSVEFEITHPDGRDRWMLAHAVPVRDEANSVYRIAGFVLDITERKRTQDALLSSERRLRALLDNLELIVLAVDAHGRVEYINPFALRLLDRSHDDVVGADWLDIFADPERTEPLMTVREELLASDLHQQMRSHLQTPSGQLHTINWYNTVVRDDAGNATGTLSIGEDVTERERLEEQFRQSQKMEAVGQLAGGVAHDFNNLLTVILSYAELIRDSFAPNDDRLQDVDPIMKAGEAAASLTRQLLTFSRQEVIRPRAVNLEDTVVQSIRLLRRVIGEHIDLRTDLSGHNLTVMIDPGQLEQVIMNLAVNARDAMPAGGQLTVGTRYTAGDSNAGSPGMATLTVSDNGSGIDEQTCARIFEPFFTTKEVGKGTGLGLAIVYGIVKGVGGTIDVSSRKGAGTTFTLQFPLFVSPDDPETPAVRIAQIPTGAETILLVEDAAAVRAVARRILERAGYKVLEAINGHEALRLAEKSNTKIHLLLTDVIMPEMSGRELADKFVLHRPETSVLFVSGYTDDIIAQHGMLAPDINFLQKPFTNEQLAQEVRRVLDSSREATGQ